MVKKTCYIYISIVVGLTTISAVKITTLVTLAETCAALSPPARLPRSHSPAASAVPCRPPVVQCLGLGESYRFHHGFFLPKLELKPARFLGSWSSPCPWGDWIEIIYLENHPTKNTRFGKRYQKTMERSTHAINGDLSTISMVIFNSKLLFYQRVTDW
jgi:hypothetical protein